MPKYNGKYEVVAIGGSWGGMDALIAILKEIEHACFIPIVVVLHRNRITESNLAEIIKKYLKLKVKEIDEKEKLTCGTIYLAPRNYHVLVEKDQTFSLDVSEAVNYARPSIDVLFESIASIYRDKAIGILLTGANSDGSSGLKQIKDQGGFTIVQDPIDAESPNMPEAALKIMTPDHIFTRQKINKFLKELIME